MTRPLTPLLSRTRPETPLIWSTGTSSPSPASPGDDSDVPPKKSRSETTLRPWKSVILDAEPPCLTRALANNLALWNRRVYRPLSLSYLHAVVNQVTQTPVWSPVKDPTRLDQRLPLSTYPQHIPHPARRIMLKYKRCRYL